MNAEFGILVPPSAVISISPTKWDTFNSELRILNFI